MVDEDYMREALKEARIAFELGEVPVGCVIVRDGVIIARGHNLTETAKDPTVHAEMNALREAAGVLGGWRLPGCSAYVTCEPCAMCAGAMVWARIEDLYIGAVPMGPQPFGGDIAHFRISDTVLNAADFLRPVRTTPAANEADDVYLHMSFEQEPGFSAGMYFDRTGKQKVIQRRSRFERPCLEPSVPASVLRPSVPGKRDPMGETAARFLPWPSGRDSKGDRLSYP